MPELSSREKPPLKTQRKKKILETKKQTELKLNYEFEQTQKKIEAENRAKELISKAELEQERKQRNLLLIGLGVISLMLVITIKNFRAKQKANNILHKQKREIERQKKIVEEKNHEINDSINYALRIQTASIPKKEELDSFLNDYDLFFKPKDVVSGDFYWAEKTSEFSLIAVGDCTGHGVPGAFMSFMGYNLLNETINEKPKGNPAELLNSLNRKVLDSLKQHDTNTSAKYGMDIALMAVNKNKKSLEFSGAHNSLMIFRGNEHFQLKADRLSVGSSVREDITTFTNHVFELQKGDMLYLYTDGYPDQTGGPDNKKFFANPFRDLLQSISKMDQEQQAKVLEETYMKWKGAKSQIDDVMVVGIRI